ncbi:hypothetical protein [Flavobacteriaceae bacterium 14752]|uniref:hypothetical protein n=1 Tax=Mesohalobacter salilacus TaxID=2491711 RepID=UPI000F63BC8D|nr:hypothetical protein EIG84_01580 [Flavobacteriaceae bacterium 14752]
MAFLFNKSGIFISTFVFFLLTFGFELSFPAHHIIYPLTYFMLLNFLYAIDRRFALPELISLITVIMYLTTPALMFDINSQQYLPPNTFGYEILAVDPDEFYLYVIPCVVFFYLITTLSFRKYREKNYILNIFNKIKQRYNVKRIIIMLGFIASFSSLFSGSFNTLNQLFYIGTQMLPIILILSILIDSKKTKKLIFVFITLILIINVLRTGMFSELVFSLLYYALFWILVNGLSIKTKLSLPLLGTFLLIILQLFKTDYRKETWNDSATNISQVDVATNVIQNLADNFDVEFLKASSTYTLFRLNHAYLCSRALRYVPAQEPYAHGETIVTAVFSIIPRVIWPEKPKLSGPELMTRFGKYTPSKYVSMSIGQLGEAYSNFGYIGGFIFFGLYGLFISYVLYKLINKSIGGAPVLIFIPIVMYHMTKPEVIYSKVLNTAFTGFVFLLLMIFFMNKFCLNKSSNYTKKL